MYGGFASGRSFIESDPIGLQGGSYSTYAYAGGDPISNVDPSGLLLVVIGNTVAEQTALQNALNTVGSTQRGNELINALKNSPVLYLITNQQNGNAYFQGTVISVDPNFHPRVNVDGKDYCGAERAPTSVILGHELGHAVRGDTVENPQIEWANIYENENPIRQQLNLPIRTGLAPVPW